MDALPVVEDPGVGLDVELLLQHGTKNLNRLNLI